MITQWLLYTLAVSTLSLGFAQAAEVLCRALGVATRSVWIAAALGAFALSAVALGGRHDARGSRPASAPRAERPTTSIVSSGTTAVESVDVPKQRLLARLSDAAARGLSAVRRAWADLDRGSPNGVDTSLFAACAAAAIAGLFWLGVSLMRARRLTRGFAAATVDGRAVLLSDDVGPAIVGVLRPIVLLPRWVLELPHEERRTILAHEEEHVASRDPAVFAGVAVLLALQPWNAALWGIVRRLRSAIESDCDARVVRAHGSVRRYGELLVTVYERTAGRSLGALAFVERRSSLERRVRRLVTAQPRLASGAGVAATCGAVLLAFAACETPIPTRSARDSLIPPPQRVAVVGSEPRCLKLGGHGGPSFDEVRDWVRARHPDAVADPRGRDMVIGLLLDETCAVVRDTVLSIPIAARAGWPDRFLVQAFGDTTGFARPRGMIFSYALPNSTAGLVTVAFGVRPTKDWQTRLANDDCGFGVRSEERCAVQGPLEIRMMDSVRALIAIRRADAPNQPAENVFMVTLARPYPALRAQSMVHGLVVYQSGAVYVEDIHSREPLLLFAPSTSNGLADLKRKQDVQLFTDLVGVAHYNAGWLTLEDVHRLAPSAQCDGPKGACYEVRGKQLRFPA